MDPQPSFAAFSGQRLVARGGITEIVARLHPLPVAAQAELRLLDEASGRAVDLDWRGEAAEVVARATAQLAGRGRGRPRLGVESREITLLPRHRAWLDRQGRSASAVLRGLVDQAMRDGGDTRAGVDALYRQMAELGGDLPGFEQAARCLYAADWAGAERILSAWPGDVGRYLVDRLRALPGGCAPMP